MFVLLLVAAVSAPACLRFECSSTDSVCRPEALLLYAREPDCNLTQSLNFGALGQQQYFKATNPDDCDEFGTTIAFDCRTQTLAVGATSESSIATGVGGNQADNSAASSGAVYVYRFRNDAWAFEAYIKASNTDASDVFGQSLDLDGDTLVVGAIGERSNATGVDGDQSDNSLVSAGAVYVFRRNGEVWSQEAYLKASNPDAQDRFGRDVAIDGDVLAVSASNEESAAIGVNGNQNDNSANASGAVYVFRRSDQNVWSQEAYIKASNTGVNDFFGTSVALEDSGDDLVGYTLAVGAGGEDSNAVGIGGDQSNDLAANSGAVYIFRGFPGFWYQEAYIKASNADANDGFGTVALSGDLLAIGAGNESSDAAGVGGAQNNNLRASSGAVYVFQRSGFSWAQTAYVKASNPDVNDAFGSRALALSGSTLAVGTITEASNATGIGGNQNDNTAANSGAAYLFRLQNGAWSQTAYIKASNAEANDTFGFQLDLSGNGLAVSAQVETSNAAGVGADQSNNLGTAVGAAYVFR